MNTITDVRSGHDLRSPPINQVGIKDLRFPTTLNTAKGSQSTAVCLTTTVFLPADQKGTHISRFVALMEQQTEASDLDRLHKLTAEMIAFLDSHSGKISVSFPLFCKKPAPVSDIQSLLDYDATLTDEVKNDAYSHNLKVMVSVASLYPCSKEIPQYGTYNWCLHITVSPTVNAEVGIEEIIGYVEAQASCQLYGLLKRPDKKHVTEKVYENLKFIEDMVCDVITALIADGRIGSFAVESENFELIHSHSAYAYAVYP